ncbi:leucine-rich repeat protein, partial [Ruminiclostridium josui]
MNKKLSKVVVMLYIISILGIFNLQPNSVLAAIPSDQLFDGKSLSGVNSLVLDGIRYTTNNNTDSLYNGICVGGCDAFCLNYGSANSTYYSGHALTNDFSFSKAPTFFQISSEDLAFNFKINSMYYIATDDGTGHKINIEGYDGDTLVASVYGVDMGKSGTYGTGIKTVTLENDINSQEDAEYGGLLTFDSGWTNIDTIRITNNNNGGSVYAVIDSLDFLENVGTDGRPVDLSLWNYSSNGNYYTLIGYKGSIKDGKIEGSVPAIINGLPLKAMYNTFRDCTGLTQAPEIPNSVTNMSFTFYNCIGLKQAPEIPEGVTDMSYTFSGCTGLTQAPEIPEGVTDMSNTFFECKGLTQAPEIPNSVKDMSYTFYGCTGLTQAPKISNSVKDMSYTFYGCTGLTQAPEIPDSVKDMTCTFWDCT